MCCDSTSSSSSVPQSWLVVGGEAPLEQAGAHRGAAGSSSDTGSGVVLAALDESKLRCSYWNWLGTVALRVGENAAPQPWSAYCGERVVAAASSAEKSSSKFGSKTKKWQLIEIHILISGICGEKY
ncbi:hypothetical protein GUJ93_ZPchr0001g29807 [Zizania palustris]|uniref:Uncharacterized protein n=1 Tax=Zizania palustris TaxID=103762 RepID=A0A8J5RTL6_ZIZPA|nr:hypothetical protein GUJ93_ZPchr0001g29807 [Zizania palustris]